jgi:hypothetical protein
VRRERTTDEMPESLIRFDIADWPETEPESDDDAIPAQQYALRLRLARRRWRSARVDWLAARGLDTMGEFLGRRSREQIAWSADIAEFERLHPAEADQ